MASLASLLTGLYVLFTGRPSWISIPRRSAGAIVASVAFVGIIVGGAVVGASAPSQAPLANVGSTQQQGLLDSSGDNGTESVTEIPAADPVPPQPVVEVLTQSVESVIPFALSSVNDPSLASGTSVISTPGADGILITTYSVTFTDGVETARKQLSQTVKVEAVNQVTTVGTKPQSFAAAPSCDPNYAGQCVPIASDVDCGGGSGNGPAYVYGVVQVIGNDIYDLDRDGNGYGCD